MSSSLDGTFRALESVERRRVLNALAEEHPRTVAELAEVAVGPDTRSHDRLHVAMHHVHLPKLDDAGLVTWEPGTERVTRGAEFGTIQPFLDVPHDGEEEEVHGFP